MFLRLLTFFASFSGGLLSFWLAFTYLPFLGTVVKLGIVLAGTIKGFFPAYSLGSRWSCGSSGS